MLGQGKGSRKGLEERQRVGEKGCRGMGIGMGAMRLTADDRPRLPPTNYTFSICRFQTPSNFHRLTPRTLSQEAEVEAYKHHLQVPLQTLTNYFHYHIKISTAISKLCVYNIFVVLVVVLCSFLAVSFSSTQHLFTQQSQQSTGKRCEF